MSSQAFPRRGFCPTVPMSWTQILAPFATPSLLLPATGSSFPAATLETRVPWPVVQLLRKKQSKPLFQSLSRVA